MSDALPLPATVVSTSRGHRASSHHVMTPANHFPSRLPHLARTLVRKLVTPRNGQARFGQYLLELEDDGAGSERPLATGLEQFLYVLDGRVRLTRDDAADELTAGGHAYLPDDVAVSLNAVGGGARVLWIKRPYEPADGVARPGAVIGHRDQGTFGETSVPGLVRMELIDPTDAGFDFNVSLMRFAPGTIFRVNEIHDEEHGLYVTAGLGIQFLDGVFHEVAKDDFAYIAPYCPQYFYAVGWEHAEYLLYKDVFRDGF
ncbi:(S)-ureidoglycine aminohydrolase [Patulibacter defluvii]|uniref:(S)-ureidoglycine aminohydrolase n=1 Tax=Patulibacter defluvii TaxID=3095358 RepID=UPI002A75242E|nr:(S)-ureidoglycine aminohydrolase [Patulibacter sp. DM4]